MLRSHIKFVANDVCRLITFVEYDVCHLMMFVTYNVCRIMRFVAHYVIWCFANDVCRSAGIIDRLWVCGVPEPYSVPFL